MSLDIIHPRNQGGDSSFFESYAERKLLRDPGAAARARQARDLAFKARRDAEERAAANRATAEAAFRSIKIKRAVGPAVVGPPSVRAIIRDVTEAHGVTVEEVLGPRRHTRFVRARQEIMWRLRHERKLSLPQIAKFLGGRDHTTVLHGVGQHQRRLDASAAPAAGSRP